jgi:D-glycero-alpha-D-manno-heptose-7-phosphate kinase
MNNWEILRERLEGNDRVAAGLEGVRRAAVAMAAALGKDDFAAMGAALAEEWESRRRLAPVVATPRIDRAIAAARAAGAWGAKACGAGGGGFVVVLSPAPSTEAVRAALGRLEEGRVVSAPLVSRGLRVAKEP